MSIGEEGLADEGLYLARKIHRAGSTAIVEQFEGMPHCFGFLMPSTPAGKRGLQGWADFCVDAVKGNVKRTGEVLWVNRTATKTAQQSLEEVCKLSEEEVEMRVKDGRDWRVEGEEALAKALEEEVSKAKL